MERLNSWDISIRFNIEHRTLRRAIKNSMRDLCEIDIVIEPKDEQKRRSRPVDAYLLNHTQWICVCMRLRDTKEHRALKRHFVTGGKK